MTQGNKTGGSFEESAVRFAFGLVDQVRKRRDDRRREEARQAAAAQRAERAATGRTARKEPNEHEGTRVQTPSEPVTDVAAAGAATRPVVTETEVTGTQGPNRGTETHDPRATNEPSDQDRTTRRKRFSFDATSDFTANAGARYGDIRDKAGVKVTEALSKGASFLDRHVGDTPWQILGMDDHGVRVAREVLTDVVPDVVGERTSAFIDGVAVRGGMIGAGAAMRMPLRGIAGPMITGLAALEAARAVQEIKDRAGDIGDRIDGESRN